MVKFSKIFHFYDSQSYKSLINSISFPLTTAFKALKYDVIIAPYNAYRDTHFKIEIFLKNSLVKIDPKFSKLRIVSVTLSVFPNIMWDTNPSVSCTKWIHKRSKQ